MKTPTRYVKSLTTKQQEELREIHKNHTNERTRIRSFEDSINSEIAIACFDYLSQQISKPTLVVIDRAPIHTSDNFIARLKDWEEQGLYVYPLPAYSPELNLIEILWRKIKYEWLPLSAYLSFDSLKNALANVLKQVCSKYQITFE